MKTEDAPSAPCAPSAPSAPGISATTGVRNMLLALCLTVVALGYAWSPYHGYSCVHIRAGHSVHIRVGIFRVGGRRRGE